MHEYEPTDADRWANEPLLDKRNVGRLVYVTGNGGKGLWIGRISKVGRTHLHVHAAKHTREEVATFRHMTTSYLAHTNGRWATAEFGTGVHTKDEEDRKEKLSTLHRKLNWLQAHLSSCTGEQLDYIIELFEQHDFRMR